LHPLFQSAKNFSEKKEGSGAGSASGSVIVPNGSICGSGRPKNIRIRIRNTDFYCRYIVAGHSELGSVTSRVGDPRRLDIVVLSRSRFGSFPFQSSAFFEYIAFHSPYRVLIFDCFISLFQVGSIQHKDHESKVLHKFRVWSVVTSAATNQLLAIADSKLYVHE
jgi:hypothetical protein